nr:hypothetical protein [Tanacetum cinerariifolium]
VKKVNDQEQIQALVDKQKVIITEESIKRDLKFDDVEGIACLPNDTIFTELSSVPTNLVTAETVYKEWKDKIERAATTTSSLEAEQDSGSKLPYWGGGAEAWFEAASKQSNDPHLSRGHTLGSREDSIKLKQIDGILYKIV